MTDFNQLMNYLNDPNRRNPEYHIVQPRARQETVAAKHTQYDRACFFFATAPIVEQLGYAHWKLGSHRNYTFAFDIGSSSLANETLDAGYHASPEHLMASYVDGDSNAFGQQHYEPDFLNTAGNDLNRTNSVCSGRFVPGQEYGLCDPIAGADFDFWMNRTRSGCSGGVHTGCACDQTANCGFYWFLNQRLQTGGWAEALDSSLEETSAGGKKFSVCTQPSGWSHDCVDPFYGLELTCHDNGQVTRKWSRNQENPFIVVDQGMDYDKLEVRFADGEHYVKSALLERYRYDARGTWPPRVGAASPHWEMISRFLPDSPPNKYLSFQGVRTEVTWDQTWADDFWLVAQGLSDPYPKRRTTILLVLNDGLETTGIC